MKPSLLTMATTALTTGATYGLMAAGGPVALTAAPVVIIGGGAVVATSAVLDMMRHKREHSQHPKDVATLNAAYWEGYHAAARMVAGSDTPEATLPVPEAKRSYGGFARAHGSDAALKGVSAAAWSPGSNSYAYAY